MTPRSRGRRSSDLARQIFALYLGNGNHCLRVSFFEGQQTNLLPEISCPGIARHCHENNLLCVAMRVVCAFHVHKYACFAQALPGELRVKRGAVGYANTMMSRQHILFHTSGFGFLACCAVGCCGIMFPVGFSGILFSVLAIWTLWALC